MYRLPSVLSPKYYNTIFLSIILLPQTHIKWMKKAIIKGHVGRGFTLYADEQYLCTAMMLSMDVAFAYQDM